MGKRGKAARKRRRENEVNTAALAASKLTKWSGGADNIQSSADYYHHADNGDSDDSNNNSNTMVETGQHGISDAALNTTVATLHRMSGSIDPATGKSVLKDKRYRSLRKVLYELQNGTSSSDGHANTSIGNNNNNGVASLLRSEIGTNNNNGTTPHFSISSSKITREISAQIDNGAWELAVTTLRNVRKLREEYYDKQHQQQSNNSSRKENTIAKTEKESDYLRPKLGAVQRWIRQIDAAGTDDPLGLEVIDAILRVVAPEAIIPVEEVDLKKATWARLGVSNTATSSNGDGKRLEAGSIRLFPPFDRRLKCDVDGGDARKPQSDGQVTSDSLEQIIAHMGIGQDGIRLISHALVNDHRDTLFRKCGYEKGADRKPPNKYDLELLTTAPNDASIKMDTFSGVNILLDDRQGLPVVKTPLTYVQDSFLLENVLSLTECNRLMAAAETAGYKPDEPLAGQPGASILAHACVWVVDEMLERTIFDRVKAFLPSYAQTKQKQNSDYGETFQPLGLNRRFRFYRYVPGRYYRPHIDGAWPKSGFDKKGKYRYDVCDEENKNGLQFIEKGEVEPVKNEGSLKQPNNENDEEASLGVTNNTRRQLSRLTFLIYLNDEFYGGHTTFLVPAQEKDGILNAFPINPVRGGVLVFPHGTCAAPLHEGSPVLKGCKYVVRTEVEYYM